MLHVVLFKLDAEKVAASLPGDEFEKQVDTLRHGAIPGLIDIEYRTKDSQPWPGYVDCSHGYTHLLVSRHESKDALRVYAEHPVHRALQERVGPCIEAPPLRIDIALDDIPRATRSS